LLISEPSAPLVLAARRLGLTGALGLDVSAAAHPPPSAPVSS
jgi:hypothetical protein